MPRICWKVVPTTRSTGRQSYGEVCQYVGKRGKPKPTRKPVKAPKAPKVSEPA